MRGQRRKLLDSQWIRLGRACEEGTSVENRRVFTSTSQRFVTAFAPIAMVAAFLPARQSSDVGQPKALGKVALENEMTKSAWCGSALAGLVVAPSFAQNLLNNGGLEGPAGSCVLSFVYPGSTAIPGWVVSGNWNVDWVRWQVGSNCTCPLEGTHFVDLNGSPNTVSGSAIRQSVRTQPGEEYRLLVHAVANDYNTPLGTVKTLRVTTGTQVTEIGLTTVPLSCVQGLPWQPIEIDFVATSSQSVIELRSTFPNNAGGIFVDAISLSRVDCPGDLDSSDGVDGFDLTIMLTNWGSASAAFPRADLNADGIIDGLDVAVLISSWGACP